MTCPICKCRCAAEASPQTRQYGLKAEPSPGKLGGLLAQEAVS
jgi:hypothetical protein